MDFKNRTMKSRKFDINKFLETGRSATEIAIKKGRKIVSDIHKDYKEAKEEIAEAMKEYSSIQTEDDEFKKVTLVDEDAKQFKFLSEQANSGDVTDTEFRKMFQDFWTNNISELIPVKSKKELRAEAKAKQILDSIKDTLNEAAEFTKDKYKAAFNDNPFFTDKVETYIDKIKADTKACHKLIQDYIQKNKNKK